jgi:hypothetical protein
MFKGCENNYDDLWVNHICFVASSVAHKKGDMAWQDTTTIQFNLFTTTYQQVCFQLWFALPCLALPCPTHEKGDMAS